MEQYFAGGKRRGLVWFIVEWFWYKLKLACMLVLELVSSRPCAAKEVHPTYPRSS
jgi:hypothetical protein